MCRCDRVKARPTDRKARFSNALEPVRAATLRDRTLAPGCRSEPRQLPVMLAEAAAWRATAINRLNALPVSRLPRGLSDIQQSLDNWPHPPARTG